jgi:hypothetical protein
MGWFLKREPDKCGFIEVKRNLWGAVKEIKITVPESAEYKIPMILHHLWPQHPKALYTFVIEGEGDSENTQPDPKHPKPCRTDIIAKNATRPREI